MLFRTDQQTKASEANMVAVDFESTGSVPGYPDHPWQIGLIPLVNRRPDPANSYESYLWVPVDRPFNPMSPGKWGAMRQPLADAPTLDQLLPALRGRVMGVPLVAHNAATERKFFRKAWPLHRLGPWIDTLVLSRQAFPGLPNYRLATVVEATGLAGEIAALFPDRAAHDALYDAAACALVLGFLLKQPGWSSVTVGDLVKASSRRQFRSAS